jgi:uncharacterized protein YhfF
VADAEDRSRYVTPLGRPDPAEVEAFWQRYLAAGGAGAGPAPERPSAGCFGDTVELADELIALVLDGTKRATAGAVADYEARGEAIPSVGDLWIATDGLMRPRAVVETTQVRVGPLSSVDDRFAWDEGEGDRSRAWWLDAHTWYFSRTFARAGREFHPDIPVVFERFTVPFQD